MNKFMRFGLNLIDLSEVQQVAWKQTANPYITIYFKNGSFLTIVPDTIEEIAQIIANFQKIERN